jgi:hypothetical protein
MLAVVRRAALILGLLAACGGRSSTGPAWPRSAGTEIDPDEEDGGESIDPRGEIAAVETSAEPEPAKPATDEVKPAVTPDATPTDKPADAKPDDATKPPEPTFEEIIIEVTGD